MKTKIALLALTTVASGSLSFAQPGPMGEPGQMPPKKPGMMQERMEVRQEFRQERREDFKDLKENMKDVREEFKEDMRERKDFMMGSSTGTATPTPWKNLRENMKDLKKDFKDDRREDRQDMMKMRPINATATQAIAAKLGITAEALQAQLASGTKLKDLIKDKISPEEMKQILPPKVATFTRVVEEKGFFNAMRSRIFGPREEVIQHEEDEFGEVSEKVSDEQAPRPFWKRFFGF